MDKRKRLALAQSIFYMIVFIFFGVIVVREKADTILMPKVKKEINEYINSNYSSIKNSIEINETKYKDSTFQTKITSKKNKNHYFYIYYKKKNISDTYKNDYLNGKNLFTKIEKELKKEIKDKTSLNCNIEVLSTLDKYTSKVQERIINEEDLLNLKFYVIKEELTIKNWSSKEITNSINEFITKITSQNIIPKYYEITITDKEDITKSIKITNLTEDFYKNPYQEQIISDIISDNNSLLLKQSKIEYKYLN